MNLNNVTIEEVAQKAGVGRGTVSRVINKQPNVNESTRRRVLRVIEGLNYRPSGVARSLVLKRTNTIGLVIPDVIHSYFPNITMGVQDVASSNGYHVILCHSDNDVQKENEKIDLLLEKRVDGLIITPSLNGNNFRTYEKLRKGEMPFVLIEVDINRPDFNFVGPDYKISTYETIIHFIKLGRKRIGYIDGLYSPFVPEIRLEGYRRALKKSGIVFLKSLVRIMNDPFEESGYQAAKSLLRNKERPTAIFCGTGSLLVGAYIAIREEGLNIPEDISLIGLTGMKVGSFSLARFTTMEKPSVEIGKVACSMLVEEIQRGVGKPKKVFLKPKLVIRETCGAKPTDVTEGKYESDFKEG